jgi:hypothetical protein
LSGPQRIGFIAGVAGTALFALFTVRHAGVRSASPERAEPEPAGVPESAFEQPIAPPAPALSLPPSPSARDGAPAAPTPARDAFLLKAISQNEQIRLLFMRMQKVGLSREQMERVVVILGVNALHRAESPTLQALRARGRHVLSPEEAARVRVERQQLADGRLRSIRPALGKVLTPAQMDQAGLGDATSPGAPAP